MWNMKYKQKSCWRIAAWFCVLNECLSASESESGEREKKGHWKVINARSRKNNKFSCFFLSLFSWYKWATCIFFESLLLPLLKILNFFVWYLSCMFVYMLFPVAFNFTFNLNNIHMPNIWKICERTYLQLFNVFRFVWIQSKPIIIGFDFMFFCACVCVYICKKNIYCKHTNAENYFAYCESENVVRCQC